MSKPSIVRVEDVMYPEFDMIEGTETIAEAVKQAKHLHTGCIIVNRRHADDEYGILLLADVAKKVIAPDKAPERVNVYEIMSKPMISVPPNMNIRYCARLFDKFGLTRAPVTKGDEILGIVSYKSMVLKGMEKITR